MRKKQEVTEAIAEQVGVTPQDVDAVLMALRNLVLKNMQALSPGEFPVPEFVRYLFNTSRLPN